MLSKLHQYKFMKTLRKTKNYLQKNTPFCFVLTSYQTEIIHATWLSSKYIKEQSTHTTKLQKDSHLCYFIALIEGRVIF